MHVSSRDREFKSHIGQKLIFQILFIFKIKFKFKTKRNLKLIK